MILLSIQQAASSAMGFTANQTMQTAQQLYEGITLDNGPVGLITYMRTDAVNIAIEAQAACRAYIEAIIMSLIEKHLCCPKFKQ